MYWPCIMFCHILVNFKIPLFIKYPIFISSSGGLFKDFV